MDKHLRLSMIVEGVEYTLEDEGMPVRVLVPRDVLDHIGGGKSPTGLMAVYDRNSETIDRVAILRYRRAGRGPVVLKTEDFDVKQSPR
jgi:hypothetical protein